MVQCLLDGGPGPSPASPGGVRAGWEHTGGPGPAPQPPAAGPSCPRPLTRQVQRKWRALRPLSHASVQKSVCRSRQRSSTAQRYRVNLACCRDSAGGVTRRPGSLGRTPVPSPDHELRVGSEARRRAPQLYPQPTVGPGSPHSRPHGAAPAWPQGNPPVPFGTGRLLPVFPAARLLRASARGAAGAQESLILSPSLAKDPKPCHMSHDGDAAASGAGQVLPTWMAQPQVCTHVCLRVCVCPGWTSVREAAVLSGALLPPAEPRPPPRLPVSPQPRRGESPSAGTDRDDTRTVVLQVQEEGHHALVDLGPQAA